MKRLLSLALVLLISAITMSAGAQNILGRWKVETDKLPMYENIGNTKVNILFNFLEDKSGECNTTIVISQPFSETTTIKFEVHIESAYTWDIEGEELLFTPSKMKTHIGNIEFFPSDPEYEAAIPMLKKMLEQQLGGLAESTNIVTDSTSIEFTDEDTLIMKDLEAGTVTLKRLHDLDKMPTFQGGDLSKFRKWVMSNMTYPKKAVKNNIQGRVVVKFVIDKDGSVTDIEVVKSPDKLLSDEAVRVVKMSPKWTPGELDNSPVRVYFTIPIDFKMVK